MTKKEINFNQTSSENLGADGEANVRTDAIAYGYFVVDGQPRVEEQSAEHVRKLFTLYAEGKTVEEIQAIFTEEGIVGTKGKPFTVNRIKFILANRTYIGEYSRLGVTIRNGVPAIIEKNMFKFVQQRLEGKNRRKSFFINRRLKQTPVEEESTVAEEAIVAEVREEAASPVVKAEVAPVVAEAVAAEEVAAPDEEVKRSHAKVKITVCQTILNAIMIISLFMVLYPLMMMIMGAFKSGTIFKTNKWLPSFPLRIENLAIAFEAIKVYIGYTLIVAVAGIAGMILISSMASFAMSKLHFIGSGVCFSLIITITMLPGVLSLTPQLLLYKGFGLRNNLFALILPMWTGGCVWAVFLLSGFYKGLPNDYFEAASLDGATAFQQFILIGLPLSTPIIATLVIMQITSVWNDYMWPKLIMEQSKYTLAAGLAFVFERSSNTSQTVKYAGYLIAAIPVALLFIFFNRFYVEGITSSGVKL